MAQLTDDPVANEALLKALTELGVENPKRAQLAGQDIDPLWVRAWHLWARHPHRQSLTNPVGNIILKLESGEQPPGEFLRAAQEQNRLHEWMREHEEHEGQDLHQRMARMNPAPRACLLRPGASGQIRSMSFSCR